MRGLPTVVSYGLGVQGLETSPAAARARAISSSAAPEGAHATEDTRLAMASAPLSSRALERCASARLSRAPPALVLREHSAGRLRFVSPGG